MPKRDAAHMDAQRERILRALIRCIADKGVERTSIADICREAGMSTGALYVHFANKGEIVAEALRFGSLSEPAALPDSWAELVSVVASLGDQLGFDIATVVRARLHLRAESVSPGKLHDLYRPMLRRSLDVLTERLDELARAGEITLRMTAHQTAIGMSALVDGMLWLALAEDRPLEQIKPDLAAALACFVSGHPGEEPGESRRTA